MKPVELRFKGWEPDRGRWTCMYQGVRLRRTPEQIGLPPEKWTAERSHEAWKEWLRTAKQQVDLTGKAPKPPKKVKSERPKKRKFVPKRDDPDYPFDDFKNSLDIQRNYLKMVNELENEKALTLEQLRAESRTKKAYEMFLELWEVFGGFRQSLDDRRYSNKIANQLLGYAKLLSRIRLYAMENKAIHTTYRIAVECCRAITNDDELNEYGDLLREQLRVAESICGNEPPTSYRGWEGPPRYRWSKMHKGIRLRVTCSELGLPKRDWNPKNSHGAWLSWLEKAMNSCDNQPE